MNRFFDNLALLQPYIIASLFLLVVVVFSAGCATTGAESAGSMRNFVTTATTTAGGAYIGAKEGDGKPKSAAVGAAAGFVVGETINFLSNKAQREAYLAGYEKGQSNAVKQQYWIARENQRSGSGGGDGFEEALYEIDVPQTDRDGVRREPTKRVIRVVLPKEGL